MESTDYFMGMVSLLELERGRLSSSEICKFLWHFVHVLVFLSRWRDSEKVLIPDW